MVWEYEYGNGVPLWFRMKHPCPAQIHGGLFFLGGKFTTWGEEKPKVLGPQFLFSWIFVIGALHRGLCEHLENLHPADSNEAQH